MCMRCSRTLQGFLWASGWPSRRQYDDSDAATTLMRRSVESVGCRLVESRTCTKTSTVVAVNKCKFVFLTFSNFVIDHITKGSRRQTYLFVWTEDGSQLTPSTLSLSS